MPKSPPLAWTVVLDTRELFEQSPQLYMERLWKVLGPSVSDDYETEVGQWLVHTAGGRSEDLGALWWGGYQVGLFETWRDDPGAVALGMFRGLRLNEYDRLREDGAPEELLDAIYATNVIRVKLDEFARPGDPVTKRIDFAFDRIVESAYAEGHRPEGEMKQTIKLFFELGVAFAVFRLWAEDAGEEQLVAGELEFLQQGPDSLADLSLPIVTHNGCELSRDDIRGYVLTYRGPVGGVHEMKFAAEGATASIYVMSKVGRLGARPVKVPLQRHVDALRELGFAEMVWPDGRKYRLSSWAGLSGIRRLRD
jgi:hypothetical protein